MSFVFVEVGARKGAKRFQGKDVRYYGFEPAPASYFTIQQNPNYGYAKVFRCALADQAGTRLFYETQHPGCSSLLKPNQAIIAKFDHREAWGRDIWNRRVLVPQRCPFADHFQIVGSYYVQTRTLDDVCQAEGIDHIDYLQLDTQGSELQVLRGAVNILQKTDKVGIEMELIPLYQDQPLMDDLWCFLKTQGFRLLSAGNEVYAREKGTGARVMVSLDGVFGRMS